LSRPAANRERGPAKHCAAAPDGSEVQSAAGLPEGSREKILRARRDSNHKTGTQREQVSGAPLLRLPSHAPRLPATVMRRPVLQPVGPAAGPRPGQLRTTGPTVVPTAGSSASAPSPCSCTDLETTWTHPWAASARSLESCSRFLGKMCPPKCSNA
jgi:hypothetical protein